MADSTADLHDSDAPSVEWGCISDASLRKWSNLESIIHVYTNDKPFQVSQEVALREEDWGLATCHDHHLRDDL